MQFERAPRPEAAKPAVSAVRTASTAGPTVQPKLVVGRADDPLEREADRVADAVMASSGPAHALEETPSAAGSAVQRKCASCDEEDRMVRGKGAANPGPLAEGVASEITSRPAEGRPLSAGERSYFEPRFGHSFDRIRIHDGPHAAKLSATLGARAFTYQNDIFMGTGQYRPGDHEGRRLLAHELAHALQQTGPRPSRESDDASRGRRG